MTLKDLLSAYEKAVSDTYFPFSTYNSNNLYERFLDPLLNLLKWNPDQRERHDTNPPKVVLHSPNGTVVLYFAAPSEEDRFQLGRTCAKIDCLLGNCLFAVVSTFVSTFIWYQGKEVHAFGVERLKEEWEQVQTLLSRHSVESGVALAELRRLAERDYDERFLQELNILRAELAKDILSVKTNLPFLKPNGEWDADTLNEVVIRLVTRFLAIRLAEDTGLPTPARLGDIHRAFQLRGDKAVLVGKNPLGRESLFTSIVRLISEFDLLYNGGIFTYHYPTDRLNIPDVAWMRLLDFFCSWRLPQEFSRLIGFTYEKFLAQALKVESKRGRVEVSLQPVTSALTRRKAQAIYYTRGPVVNFIGEKTLGAWLAEKQAQLEQAVENFHIAAFTEILREVKAVKVLDPACGSGSFLLKLLELLKEFYKQAVDLAHKLEQKLKEFEQPRLRGVLFSDDSEVLAKQDDMEALRREVAELKYPGAYALRHNLYGVDFDRKAIDIAAFTLMVGVYDELQQGAKCPALVAENLKVGNSLVSPIVADPSAFAPSETVAGQISFPVPEEVEAAAEDQSEEEMAGEEEEEALGKKQVPFPEGFARRTELPCRYQDAIARLIALRQAMARLSEMSDGELSRLVKERYERLKAVYPRIRERYPNALPPELWKQLDEWHRNSDSEPPEKAIEFFIQAKIAASLLRFTFLAEEHEILMPISTELRRPLVRFFNSERKVLSKRALGKILDDPERLAFELRFSSNLEDSLAEDISPNQPPKAFLWELEFPEVFFKPDGSLKPNPGFHLIVGNPPYGRVKEISCPEHGSRAKADCQVCSDTKAEKAILSKFFGSTFPFQQGNINYYKLFLERCWFLLRDGGRFGMIFPTPFNGEAHSTILRRAFFEQGQVSHILQFPLQAKVFGDEMMMDTTIWVYRKGQTDADYAIKLRTNIQEHELPRLSELRFTEIRRSQVFALTGDAYRIPALTDLEREWALLMKLAKLPKLNGLVRIGEGHLHETNDKNYMSTEPSGHLLVRGVHVRRYFVDLSEEGEQPRWVKREAFLQYKPTALQVLQVSPKIIGRQMVHRAEQRKLHFTILEGGYVLSNGVRWLLPNPGAPDSRYIVGLLNSALLDWYFRAFSFTYNIKPYELEALPFVLGTDEQVQAVCALVDAITEKKKRLHDLKIDLNNFVQLDTIEKAPLEKWLSAFAIREHSLRLEPVAMSTTEPVKRLRARIEDQALLLEYAVPVENPPVSADEEEAETGEAYFHEACPKVEKVGKRWYAWQLLASSTVKDELAALFLCHYLRRIAKFSAAKKKTLWQKVGETPVPVWTAEVKCAVTQWRNVLVQAAELQAEIERIDREIDRLVYQIYGLSEDEIQIVENSLRR